MPGNKACRDAAFRATLVVGFTVLFVASAFTEGNGRQGSSESAEELVRQVSANELKAEKQDRSRWNFLLETRNANDQQQQVDEVIQTKDGNLRRPILIAGRALTAEQRQNSDKHIQQLLRDPSPVRKARAQQDEDTARSQRLLGLLPNAFNFTYGERHGDLVQLNFSPKPKFHPPSREAEVFHAMQGSLWVDTRQSRLEEISGRLTQEVKFGGGLLGHLNQGGTFRVKQAEVAPGHWQLTLLKVDMQGKALFFKTIGVRENYVRSRFKQVPVNLTLAQAAEMLEKAFLGRSCRSLTPNSQHLQTEGGPSVAKAASHFRFGACVHQACGTSSRNVGRREQENPVRPRWQG